MATFFKRTFDIEEFNKGASTSGTVTDGNTQPACEI